MGKQSFVIGRRSIKLCEEEALSDQAQAGLAFLKSLPPGAMRGFRIWLSIWAEKGDLSDAIDYLEKLAASASMRAWSVLDYCFSDRFDWDPEDPMQDGPLPSLEALRPDESVMTDPVALGIVRGAVAAANREDAKGCSDAAAKLKAHWS